MGFLKDMKNMKAMVAATPELLNQSSQLSANARVMADAREAAALATLPTAPAAPAVASDLSPIAGVDLELYTAISKSFAEVGYDQARGPELAARKGVSAADWELAQAGWNARMQADPAVASRFNALYTAN